MIYYKLNEKDKARRYAGNALNDLHKYPDDAAIEKALENNLENDNVRVISGDVLTGKNVGSKGHLAFGHNQLSAS